MKSLPIIITLAIAFLVPNLALAEKLSSISSKEYIIPAFADIRDSEVGGLYTVHFKKLAINPSTEKDISKCLTLSSAEGSWDYEEKGKATRRQIHAISALKNEIISSGEAERGTFLKKAKLTGKLINTCNKEVKLEMSLSNQSAVVHSSTDNLWETVVFVPPSVACGVELVSDNIEFGDIKQGTTVKNCNIKFEHFTGHSLIEMTSPDIKNYQLKLGNTNDLIIRVPSKYEEDQKTWYTDVNSPTIPLTLKASASLKPGTYKSRLTVKLTCQ